MASAANSFHALPVAQMIRHIGRYEIQALIGQGGFGQVFRAFDPTVGRPVAIKTLNAAGDRDLIQRFRNEAAAAGRLRHQNIIIIYDFGEFEGMPFLVMELLDGEDLEHTIRGGRVLSLVDKLDVIGQSASGLHHAHSTGIVHRDVKPANIMLQRDGVVKIMDFGIALLSQATAARLTATGEIPGTVSYMAPEQLSAAGASDVLTDIWGFGVTCYKLLTGIHPFQADNLGATVYKIINAHPEPIRALLPECPEALEEAVMRMLVKDREQRYQSLEEVRFDLEPITLELRRERVGELLAQAKSMLQENRLDTVQPILRTVLETDPGNRTAREMRDELQRRMREAEVRPKLAAPVDERFLHLQQTETAGVKPAPVKPDPPKRPSSGLRIGAIAGAIAALVGLAVWLFTSRSQPAVLFALDARTDPEGSPITVAGQLCKSATCRFDLPAGGYTLQSERTGYRTASRAVRVGPGLQNGLITLVLEPDAPPPIAPGTRTGMLTVRTVPGARVMVDNVAQGVTNAQGELTAKLETGKHQVKVEKAGFRTPEPRTVTMAADSSERLELAMGPEPARVDPRAVPAGAPPGKNAPPASASSTVAQPATPPAQVQTAPSSTVQPPAAPVVTAEQREAQEWDRVRKSADAAQVEAFLRDHPDGRFSADARAQLQRLTTPPVTAPPPAVTPQAPAQTADTPGLQAAIQQFNNAFLHRSSKELKRAWQKAPQNWVSSLDQKGSMINATLYPQGQPEVKGDQAMWRCELDVQIIVRNQWQAPQRKSVTVTFMKSGAGWIIDNLN